VDDLDGRVAEISGRGLEPTDRQTYANGVRKATYRDDDGNEVGFEACPATDGAAGRQGPDERSP
jgi:hypothetical protein